MKHRLAGVYQVPFDRPCKHEFVASAADIKARTGVRTLDIAKRLPAWIGNTEIDRERLAHLREAPFAASLS